MKIRNAVLLLLLLFVAACSKFITPENERTVSSHGEDESHNFGTNCMNCHYTEGQGEGFFTVAGSAEGPTTNANFELYRNTNEPPIMVVEVDQLGNAYTTEAIDFTGGLKVAVRAANGEREFMDDLIYTGQCNLCHGTSIAETVEIED